MARQPSPYRVTGPGGFEETVLGRAAARERAKALGGQRAGFVTSDYQRRIAIGERRGESRREARGHAGDITHQRFTFAQGRQQRTRYYSGYREGQQGWTPVEDGARPLTSSGVLLALLGNMRTSDIVVSVLATLDAEATNRRKDSPRGKAALGQQREEEEEEQPDEPEVPPMTEATWVGNTVLVSRETIEQSARTHRNLNDAIAELFPESVGAGILDIYTVAMSDAGPAPAR